MSQQPGLTISVVICTRDRPDSLSRALRSVTGQGGRDFEVVVVDDGSQPPVHLASDHYRPMRLIRLEGRGAGAARAAGLDAACGRYIAYCDDDDEWAPRHLDRLAGFLDDHPAVTLVYADSGVCRDDGSMTVDSSEHHDALNLIRHNCIFPSDVMHRTEPARAAGGFDPSLHAYEDWDLWLRLSRGSGLLRHLPEVLGRRHRPANSVTQDRTWTDATRVRQAAQRRLEGCGVAAEHDLVLDAAQKRGFDPETWTAERRELIWHSIFVKWSSYGLVARTMLPELERQGIDVTVAPSGTQAPRGLERFFRPLDHWGRFAVYFDWRDRPSVLPSERIICISPVDTTRVPEATIREINQAVALLYVPSRRNLQSYRESGVRVPTRVLHRGVDPDHFPVLERPQRETFTFGTFGDLSVRKGVDVLIRAFGDEFAPGEPVRLVLKTVQPFSHDDLDPRIRVVTGFLDRGRLLDLLAEMDAFVQPSRGEAFGLCGLQAMSTGLPLIATYWDGPVEYLEPSDTFPLSFTLVEAAGAEANYVRYFGTWAEPDYEHLRYLMRYLYEHPEEGRQKGALAAQRVRRDWGWGRIARQVRDDLDKIA